MPVIAIGVDDVVVRPKRGDEADTDRFLADRKVKIAGELGLGIGKPGAVLEAADEKHLPVKSNQFFLIHSRGVCWGRTRERLGARGRSRGRRTLLTISCLSVVGYRR